MIRTRRAFRMSLSSSRNEVFAEPSASCWTFAAAWTRKRSPAISLSRYSTQLGVPSSCMLIIGIRGIRRSLCALNKPPNAVRCLKGNTPRAESALTLGILLRGRPNLCERLRHERCYRTGQALPRRSPVRPRLGAARLGEAGQGQGAVPDGSPGRELPDRPRRRLRLAVPEKKEKKIKKDRSRGMATAHERQTPAPAW